MFKSLKIILNSISFKNQISTSLNKGMIMHILDIISKKRDQKVLTREEIKFFLDGYIHNQIPDYQVATLLMAIYLNGMNEQETADLTELMMHSGQVIDLSAIAGLKLDKHSTGGVGDKVSLVLVPILAACGAKVAKMTGRGLEHTGGTIDKLETIPGFSCFLDVATFKKLVEQSNLAIIGQTDDLVPADKKIYALRDVTATVGSLPLIVASILSKKFATGSNTIIIDLKCGSGAFMKTLADAEALGNLMLKVGRHLKRDIKIKITNMEQPLGKMIGNKNEVLEAMQTLKGHGESHFLEVIYSLATTMLAQGQITNDPTKARQMIDQVIKNGQALAKFFEMVQNQGGNTEIIQQANWWNPQYTLEIKAPASGYVYWKNALVIGLGAMKLGAGRKTKEDQLDNEAGIEILKLTNEEVKAGQAIMKLYSSKPIDSEIAKEITEQALEIKNQKHPIQMVLKELA